jgi:hypothetical protein
MSPMSSLLSEADIPGTSAEQEKYTADGAGELNDLLSPPGWRTDI